MIGFVVDGAQRAFGKYFGKQYGISVIVLVQFDWKKVSGDCSVENGDEANK